MKPAFTLIIDETSNNINIISKLDQSLKEANLELHSKEIKQNGRLVYTICGENFTNSNAISKVIENISTSVGLKANGPYKPEESISNQESEKTTSQEIWTLSEQSSISPDQINTDSNSVGIDAFQKFQEISDESEEFQVLGEQMPSIQRCRSEAVKLMENTPNKQQNTGTFEPIKENFVIQNAKKEEEKPYEAKTALTVERINQAQWHLKPIEKKDENAKIKIDQNLEQKENPILQKNDQLKMEEQEREETAQIIFNYYTGKDDYTEVFKLKRGDDEGQLEIQQQIYKESLLEPKSCEEKNIKPEKEAQIPLEIPSESKNQSLDVSIRENVFFGESNPIQQEQAEKPTEKCQKNQTIKPQQQKPTQIRTSQTEQLASQIFAKTLSPFLAENKQPKQSTNPENMNNQLNEPMQKFASKHSNLQTSLPSFAKYAIFIAIILAFLASFLL